MKRLLWILLFLLLTSVSQAKNEPLWVSPETSYRIEGMLHQVFKNFDDSELNQLRLDFIKETTGNTLTADQVKKAFSKITFHSNSQCLLCLQVGSDKLAYNISTDRKKLLVSFNNKNKSFNLDTLSVKEIETFVVSQKAKKTSYQSLLQFLGIATAHAKGNDSKTAVAADHLGFILSVGGGFGIALAAMTVGLPTSALLISGGLFAGGLYSLYKGMRIRRNIGAMKSGTICCQMIDKMFNKSNREKRKLQNEMQDNLEKSCIADVDKFLTAINEKSTAKAQLNVTDISRNGTNRRLHKIRDHRFIKKALNLLIRNSYNTRTAFNRCSMSDEELEKSDNGRVDGVELKPTQITKRGQRCRKRFQDAWKEYQTTPSYKMAMQANQCRSKMREITSDAENSRPIFNNNRQSYEKPLREYRDSASQFLKSTQSM